MLGIGGSAEPDALGYTLACLDGFKRGLTKPSLLDHKSAGSEVFVDGFEV